MSDKISLFHGAGGRESRELFRDIRKILGSTNEWFGADSDAAYMKFGDKYLAFTTDSFVVSPLFFRGGDIGKIAACGTMNDLAVMGAKPLGLSLSFVVEEGFPKDDLQRILRSIKSVCEKEGVPVVTGDTKVMENGKIDKLIINTSGIGIAEKIFNEKISPGDKILLSGAIAEHGAALLAERFGYGAEIVSDAKPVTKEAQAIAKFVKQARDPTRGGIAATLNELAEKNKLCFSIAEEKIPVKKEVRKICELLGLSPYGIASEGRFVCIVPEKNARGAEEILKKFNPDAAIIGEAIEGNGVVLRTKFGKRILAMPSGNLVPRIC